MTPDWPSALVRPQRSARGGFIDTWFRTIATMLLTRVRLVAGGVPHRLVEIELYYHGDDHPDPFAHRDPVQVHRGRWYFHRSHGVYRGGSFKGSDLTFGDAKGHAGVLLRSVEKPDGSLVVGPSLLVDHWLSLTGFRTVAELDGAIGSRPAWDASSPLYFRQTAEEDRTIWRTARVGLSLKRKRPEGGEAARYLLRPDRFLTEPRRISKGKAQMVMALHLAGQDPQAIHAATGCPVGAIQRYLAAFEAGRQAPVLEPFFGTALGPRDLCRLHGVGFALWGRNGEGW